MFFIMNSTLFSKTSVFTLKYELFLMKNHYFSKTSCFEMNYALFFKNTSFYYELCTARLGTIGTFLAPGGVRAEPEPSRAEPSRAGPGRAEPSRAEPIRAGPRRPQKAPEPPSKVNFLPTDSRDGLGVTGGRLIARSHKTHLTKT